MINLIKTTFFLITFSLLTGCGTTTKTGENIPSDIKVLKGVEAYEYMVKRWELQGLDLSDPNFKSLKEDMICFVDYNKAIARTYATTGPENLFSNCHSENDKVYFVFGNRNGGDSLMKEMVRINSYFAARSRKDNSNNLWGSSCQSLKFEKYGRVGLCKRYKSSNKEIISNYYSYFYKDLLIILGEKSLKEENDPTSLLPKIREVLIKVK